MVGICVNWFIFLDAKQCIRCNTPYIEYTSENSSGHNFVFDSVFDEKSSQVFSEHALQNRKIYSMPLERTSQRTV